MGVTKRLLVKLRGSARPDPLPSIRKQLNDIAARFEAHTFNLAEHEAQMREESMRKIVNEMRANTAFLADSVVAIERAEVRRGDNVHAAVRPAVWRNLHADRPAGPVVLVEQVDAVLVDELLVAGRRVIVVAPATDVPPQPEVSVYRVPVQRYAGPRLDAAMIVWVVRGEVDAAAADALRGWLAPGGVLVLATTGAVAELPGYRTIDTARYAKSGASWRPASSGELTVGILEAA